MSAGVRDTANGSTLGMVYTPTQLRGRGDASNLIARLSDHLFGEGRDFVCLFTDLANPVSGAVYRRIGFRQIAAAVAISFA
ncbi:MAG: hypothetical protein GY944_10355 [bacterium]|nr:hypothetical protein [bacterium]